MRVSIRVPSKVRECVCDISILPSFSLSLPFTITLFVPLSLSPLPSFPLTPSPLILYLSPFILSPLTPSLSHYTLPPPSLRARSSDLRWRGLEVRFLGRLPPHPGPLLIR